MRDVPRSLIGDPAEVVHFLGRTARAIERIRDEQVPIANTAPKTAPAPVIASPVRALTARDAAEGVFRPSGAAPPPQVATVAPPRPRIVADRKGRSVRVEVRRARAAGQMEMLI